MLVEQSISKSVENYAIEKGMWELARYQAQSNLNGLPDRLYLYKGILLGIELKAPNGKPTGLQLKKLKMINSNGGIGVLVDSLDKFKNLISWIDRLEKSNLLYGKDNSKLFKDREYYQSIMEKRWL